MVNDIIYVTSTKKTCTKFERILDFAGRSAVQLSGEDVVATLEQACREIGYPDTIRVDNGSEFKRAAGVPCHRC